jgi:hypothetical protein
MEGNERKAKSEMKGRKRSGNERNRMEKGKERKEREVNKMKQMEMSRSLYSNEKCLWHTHLHNFNSCGKVR